MKNNKKVLAFLWNMSYNVYKLLQYEWVQTLLNVYGG